MLCPGEDATLRSAGPDARKGDDAMKGLLGALAALALVASTGAALAEGGCHSERQQQSAEAPPPPPPPSEPTT